VKYLHLQSFCSYASFHAMPNSDPAVSEDFSKLLFFSWENLENHDKPEDFLFTVVSFLVFVAIYFSPTIRL
jgi:hypothetical protein